jgi:hypothetical protein
MSDPIPESVEETGAAGWAGYPEPGLLSPVTEKSFDPIPPSSVEDVQKEDSTSQTKSRAKSQALCFNYYNAIEYLGAYQVY